MTRSSWNVVRDEKQLAALREALLANEGNITRATKDLNISRSHATRLMKKFALVEFAAELRVLSGMFPAARGERKGVVAGRPRK